MRASKGLSGSPSGGGNTEYWRRREEVARYERKHRLLVPRKQEALRTVVSALPYPGDWRGTVLDLGAGQGALSAAVLARYPRCRVTLLDASAEMLEVAKGRLARHAGRLAFAVADLNSDGWLAAVQPRYDVVASAYALHFLDPAGRPAFFAGVRSLLEPGGWFLDVDAFNSEDPHLDAWFMQMQLGYLQRQLWRLEGRRESLEALGAHYREVEAEAAIRRSTATQEMEHLRQAGFASVECVWRLWRFAAVAAREQAGRGHL